MLSEKSFYVHIRPQWVNALRSYGLAYKLAKPYLEKVEEKELSFFPQNIQTEVIGAGKLFLKRSDAVFFDRKVQDIADKIEEEILKYREKKSP